MENDGSASLAGTVYHYCDIEQNMQQTDVIPIMGKFSYTGKTAQHMGFVDNKHFWYTWGDTTYFQEIAED